MKDVKRISRGKNFKPMNVGGPSPCDNCKLYTILYRQVDNSWLCLDCKVNDSR